MNKPLHCVFGCLLILMCIAGLTAPTASQAQDSAKVRPLLDPSTDAATILYRSFQRSGWPAKNSALFAARALGREGYTGQRSLESFFVRPDGVTRALLDPETDPYTILFHEFRRSGWPAKEASRHAADAVARAVVPAN